MTALPDVPTEGEAKNYETFGGSRQRAVNPVDNRLWRPRREQGGGLGPLKYFQFGAVQSNLVRNQNGHSIL